LKPRGFYHSISIFEDNENFAYNRLFIDKLYPFGLVFVKYEKMSDRTTIIFEKVAIPKIRDLFWFMLTMVIDRKNYINYVTITHQTTVNNIRPSFRFYVGIKTFREFRELLRDELHKNNEKLLRMSYTTSDDRTVTLLDLENFSQQRTDSFITSIKNFI